MSRIFFTCGPSQLYPTVKNHYRQAFADEIGSISHRSSEYQNIYRDTQSRLKKLMSIPAAYKIFFLSSALESMERIIENCVAKYSFHFVNGSFSRKFYQFAGQLGKKPIKATIPDGEGFYPENFRIPKKIELICLTQNETSTGVAIPVKNLNKIRHSSNSLIAIDIVSSAPYVNLDFANVDLAFFSLQKGFGLPAGLSVLVVSEWALEKSRYLEKKGISTGSYHTFVSLEEKDSIFQNPETPNVLSIYLLGKVCRDMLKKGIKKIRQETEDKAKLTYDFFDYSHPVFKPLVKDSNFRSPTTIAIDLNGENKQLISKLKTKGFVVSSGYGQFKKTHIRIANFPAHSRKDFKNLLRACLKTI